MENNNDKNIKEGEVRIIKPFGPSVGMIKMPQTLVNNLNKYIDEIIENKSKSKDLDHGKQLAGNVTQEFVLEKDFAEKSGWINFLAQGASAWISFSTGKKITKFDLIKSWAVRQFKNEYNPIHWHGGHISGVGYLKVPKTLGDPVQKDSKNHNANGNLELVHGTKMFLSNSIVQFKPEIGNFYFFPNYMMHTVYPFSGTDEERRSISFNANINPEIYNVYNN